MLVNDSTQTCPDVFRKNSRKASEARAVREGVELWKKAKEEARMKKLKEQKEAKRFVGTLDMGRPGGGAPLVTDTGKKLTRTREDPLLRFQFGSHDLRRCVDNTLRYKTNRLAQEEYRKELDKLVEEKRKQQEQRKLEEQRIDQEQGWSSEKTLRKLNTNLSKNMAEHAKNESGNNNNNINRTESKMDEELPAGNYSSKVRKLDPIFYPCKNVYTGAKNRKLSPLPPREGKENNCGIELVPLLAKQRRFPMKIHLDSTDVTNDKKNRFTTIWNRQGSAYLKELTKQILNKQEKIKTLLVLLIFATTTTTIHAKEDESNEINLPNHNSNQNNSPINLDSNLRRALLKALTELENEENERYDNKKSSPSESTHHRIVSKDKIIEKATASALSFFTSTNNEHSTLATSKDSLATNELGSSSSSSSSTTSRPIVVVQRSNGLQHKPITSFETRDSLKPYHTHDGDSDEQIVTSASSSFSSKFDLKNTVSRHNSLDNSVEQSKSEATTVKSSSTATTEESEAKVEDVQFFSAPLVAAFTVHQDERGRPKSVEPIFKSASTTSAAASTITTTIKPTTTNFVVPTHQQPQQQQSTTRDQTSALTTGQHLALQQKQQILEEEILRLKQQQQQQNYLIRQQQLLHEQQLQLQRQKLLEERIRLQNNQQSFVPVNNNLGNSNQPSTSRPTNNNSQQFQPVVNNFSSNQQQLANRFNNTLSNSQPNKAGSLVSFQPSISLDSRQAQRFFEPLPLNAQQLPIKNAIYFRTPAFPNFSQQPQQQPQFNSVMRQQQLPFLDGSTNFQGNLATKLSSSQSNTNHLSSNNFDSNSAPRHNRVFRQESNTGNFLNTNGFTPSFQNFAAPVALQQPQQLGDFNSNRFFRDSSSQSVFTSPSQYNFNRIQSPLANHQHLNNLLYNSGVIPRQNEDLNIVSKVLSLNYLNGDHRFASAGSNEQRIPFGF